MQTAVMIKFDSVAAELKYIRETAGIKLREMARRLDMPPSSYSHYENPGRFKDPYLPMDLAIRIAKAVEQEHVSAAVMRLAEHGESTVGALPSRVDDGEAAPLNSSLVPVYDISASAGPGSVIDEEVLSHSLAFPPDYLRRITTTSPKNLVIITVKGDSMEPTLPHGAIVMLDVSKQNLGFDGLFVIRIDDTLHVKRIGRSAMRDHVLVMSDNPRHNDLDLPLDRIEPVGKVLWYGREA